MSRWDQPGVPHKGWICVNVIDLKEESAGNLDYESCSMCGRENIRYVHIMTHSDFKGEMRAGCICAGKMTGDYAGAKSREKVLRNKAARKAKWLTRKWRTSANGNRFINIEGENIGVYKKNNRWYARIGANFYKKSFKSEEEAKLYLFENFWKKISED